MSTEICDLQQLVNESTAIFTYYISWLDRFSAIWNWQNSNMWLTVRHFANVQHYVTNLEQYTTESTDVNDRVFSNMW